MTAALSAFTAITGYPLNPLNAKRMLKKTAIPHPHLPTNANMGAGMVNVLKIGEVAFKLQKICQGDKSCYAQHLLEEDSFIFSVNKQELLTRVSDIFPNCLGRKGTKGSALKQEELLENLRRAALLAPYDGELWRALACINRQKCLWKYADYYHSLAVRVGKTDQEIVDSLLQKKEYEFVARYFLPYGSKVTEGLLNRTFFIQKYQKYLAATELVWLVDIIIQSEERISKLSNLLKMIINHKKVADGSLREIGEKIAQSAENIPEHEELLKAIINHQKIELSSLRRIRVNIEGNIENIPAHEEFLTIINQRLHIRNIFCCLKAQSSETNN